MSSIERTDDSLHINTVSIVANNNKTDFIEKDRSNDIPHKHIIVFKLIFFIFLISFLFLAKVYFVPSISIKCINDPVHNFLSFINDQVNQGNQLAKVIQISSSLLMDLSFITVLIYWQIIYSYTTIYNLIIIMNRALYTQSSRLVLVISLFYIFRAFNEILIQMTKPNGFYWDYPGFPSIVVPYGFTSDFFFSGHTGFLTICLFEWREIKKTKMFITTLIILIYMIFVLLVFRTHYSIDIMMGFVCAHYIFNLINQNVQVIDNFIGYTLRSIYFYIKSKTNKKGITTV